MGYLLKTGQISTSGRYHHTCFVKNEAKEYKTLLNNDLKLCQDNRGSGIGNYGHIDQRLFDKKTGINRKCIKIKRDNRCDQVEGCEKTCGKCYTTKEDYEWKSRVIHHLKKQI